MPDAIPALLRGAIATLEIATCGTLLATLLGVLAAVVAQAGAPLRVLIATYVSFIRGTPLLVQLLVVYYLLPRAGLDVTPFWAGVVALGVNGGAHIREMIRGALTAIPPGQIEAARALAMPRFWIWARIVLPQVFVLILPPLTVEFSALLKGSALISIVGYVELTRQAQYQLSTSSHPYAILIATAAIYGVMCLAVGEVTRQMRRGSWRRGAAA
ncbi:MAG TPA: amino acid ABC transporter permease [Stellaceae bacterium]|nr:amino acid ABC transporter permease [Stellaceae bacterium]